MSCPCGSNIELTQCCEAYVFGKKSALTAEALMRSRYTSYEMQKVGYIIETHHPDSRDDVDWKTVQKWAEKAQWQELKIVEIIDGQENDDEGVVEFVAKFHLDGSDRRHHERSTFKKVEGKWYYVRGEEVKAKPIVSHKKVGRNEPCVCGSGKKYKRCCMIL